MNAAPIATFLTAAQDRGLRLPKARFLAPDGNSELKLATAGPMSRVPGSISVTVAGQWVGRITPSGEVQGRLAGDTTLLAHLNRIAEDPARFAREYGRLTSCCSFCGLGLTDAGSVEAGYGPICARRYGLPHVAVGTPELVDLNAAPRVASRRQMSVDRVIGRVSSVPTDARIESGLRAACAAEQGEQDWSDADEFSEEVTKNAHA